MVRPNWCREISEGIRAVWDGCVHQDDGQVVGRVQWPESSYLRRLPGQSMSLPRAVTDLGPIPFPCPVQRRIDRVICECVCDNYAAQTRGNLERKDARGDCATPTTDYSDSGVSSPWGDEDFERLVDAVCSSPPRGTEPFVPPSKPEPPPKRRNTGGFLASSGAMFTDINDYWEHEFRRPY